MNAAASTVACMSSVPGLAGLAAAVALAGAGRAVQLYEARPHAGGRCRSYFDAELGCRIDNGNHLLLAGNRAALDYLDRIGARGTLEGPAEAVFPFVDAGDRRALDGAAEPRRSAVVDFAARTRGSRKRARATISAALALRRADPSATDRRACSIRRQRLFRRLWEPLAVAALNTGAEQGSAALFWRILAETLGRGGAACRPLVPRDRPVGELCRAGARRACARRAPRSASARG